MLSPERLERLRRSLLEEQTSLRQQLSSLNMAGHEANIGLGNHMAEDATAAFDQATMLSLRRGKELTLNQVEQALQRMETGTYGLCDRCGDEIDFARLKALPHARLCMACQKLVEM